MRNCLIMGFGRSGTSLMAGILNQSGYFSGNDLYPPRKSNPHGFFENAFINGINEGILEKYDYKDLSVMTPSFPKQYSPYQPGVGQRWLTYIPADTTIDQCDEKILSNIREAIQISGYAYKDPRFNYTLGIWNKQIKDDTLFVCMYRQPEITVGSVLLECEYADYLSEFYIEMELAYSLWFNSYTHLLKVYSSLSPERFLFIHYEQLLNRSILTDLESKLNTPIDPSFIRPFLNRSRPVGAPPLNVRKLYEALNELSGFRG